MELLNGDVMFVVCISVTTDHTCLVRMIIKSDGCTVVHALHFFLLNGWHVLSFAAENSKTANVQPEFLSSVITATTCFLVSTICASSHLEMVPEHICQSIQQSWVQTFAASMLHSCHGVVFVICPVTIPAIWCSYLQKAMREKLHWLRITDRINYKLCLLVYKALHGQAPAYLQELCILASSDIRRTRLRSAHRGDLIVPRVNLSKYGQRSFAYVAPHNIWNSLPQKLKDSSLSLNVFKRKLKTQFFLSMSNL